MAQRKLNDTTDCNYSVEETREVGKDVESLSNIPSFISAYGTFKKALPQLFCEREFWKSHGINQIADLKCQCKAFVIKKIQCKGLGNDKLRATFMVNGNIIRIIEVYSKNHKDIEDKKRICKYCND
ncbi:MAG: hypothetical protein QXU18_05595 [Thermoplasmatales archaeon]